jgi:transcriptional repressor NrdR
MVCLYCASPTRVTNSRPQQGGTHIWRRRLCTGCGAIFTSREQPELHTALVVENRDGSLSPFNRDRLLLDLYESCKHRHSAADDATALTRTVIELICLANKQALIKRHTIAQTTLSVLQRFDPTAATIYAAYHPSRT